MPKLLKVTLLERERHYHIWTQKETIHLIKLYNSMYKLDKKFVVKRTIDEFIKRFPDGHFTRLQIQSKLVALFSKKENTGFKSCVVDSVRFNLQ